MRRSALLHTMMIAGTAWLAAGNVSPLHAQDPEDSKRGVARVSLINGDVSVRRGDSGDWVAAAVNAPVMAQDRISTGPSSRTEVQFDWANMVRIGANAEVHMAQLEYRRYILQIARGTVTFRVLRDSDADVEVDTPNVSVRPRQRGIYRVTVHDDGSSEVTVRAGDAEIFTPRGSQRLAAGQTMQARGTASEPEFQIAGAIPTDDWDRWNENRDRTLERASGYRYVSRDVYGVEDLDPYGTWVQEPPYGWVWRPVVVAGWAPYRHGRWVWVDWYGWTWVSYDPWGWAPYHYGRWFHSARGWCWYPGGIGVRHYWSPALVAFFGFGRGVRVGIGVGGGWGHVGWVPLAPREPFSRWWGRNYYGGYRNSTYIDRSVNITNNVNITNIYRNSRVTNGVTAVNAGDFSQGRFTRHVRVENSHLREASLSRGVMPAAPGDAHLRYSDRQVTSIPRGNENTRFFSRRQPEPVQRVSFAEQRQSLERVSRVPIAERSVAAVTANPTAPVTRSEAPARGGEFRGSRTPTDTAAARSDGPGWRRAEQPGTGTAATVPTRNEGRTSRRSGEATVSGAATSPPAAAADPAAPTRSEGRGSWRRFGESAASGSAATPASGTSAPSRTAERAPGMVSPRGSEGSGSWRRFGEPAGSGNTATPPSGTEAPSRTAERAPGMVSPRGSEGSGSWRRFGESGTSGSPATAPASTAAPVRSEGRRDGDRSNWRRFGESGGSSAPPAERSGASAPGREDRDSWRRSTEPASTPAAPSRNEGRGGWQRFGDPGSGASSPAAVPRTERPSGEDRQRGWSRFGEPGSPARGIDRSAPRDETPRYSAPQRQESIRIAPPVVRERSAPQYQQRSAPQYQQRSSPTPSRGSQGRSQIGGSVSRGGDRGGRGGRGR